jgi:hypothetical protein
MVDRAFNHFGGSKSSVRLDREAAAAVGLAVAPAFGAAPSSDPQTLILASVRMKSWLLISCGLSREIAIDVPIHRNVR